MYSVKVDEKAENFIRLQTKKIQRQIINKLRALGEEPRPTNCKKLQGYPELYRIKSGKYRIVYQIQDEELLVFVVRID